MGAQCGSSRIFFFTQSSALARIMALQVRAREKPQERSQEDWEIDPAVGDNLEAGAKWAECGNH